uniref:Uncharacterized protein n=1 Tax=Chromera velia CCMP2878 TaxID=1169474 RepID=A0A0G4HJI9_9ALVE|eukprot:Cvel_28287.t1-p1 / transcript=Cvel_28287.t1 / gene=Cvel_28287 / organism=Chromera_velia_CCMP2878 / gene_product=hypothetical protein / transcript_product=hypothetical protein / location=Cvel_scaffold3668:13235-13987(+) / protein_length=251 / sequence_SO=supercontig / SO=protein_coding / is_pseudo=false
MKSHGVWSFLVLLVLMTSLFVWSSIRRIGASSRGGAAGVEQLSQGSSKSSSSPEGQRDSSASPSLPESRQKKQRISLPSLLKTKRSKSPPPLPAQRLKHANKTAVELTTTESAFEGSLSEKDPIKPFTSLPAKDTPSASTPLSVDHNKTMDVLPALQELSSQSSLLTEPSLPDSSPSEYQDPEENSPTAQAATSFVPTGPDLAYITDTLEGWRLRKRLRDEQRQRSNVLTGGPVPYHGRSVEKEEDSIHCQ